MISLGAGEVPNGRCEDFPIGVGGAKVGEGVLLSLKSAAPQGVLMICNLSGGTMPALSDFHIRIITFD